MNVVLHILLWPLVLPVYVSHRRRTRIDWKDFDKRLGLVLDDLEADRLQWETEHKPAKTEPGNNNNRKED